jgi:hypothetical protein
MGFEDILGGSFNEEMKEMLDRPSPSTGFADIEYITPKLDFTLDPDHFIKWLKAEADNDQYLDPPLGESYAMDVGSMCEYSCLYVAMLLDGAELKGDLRIVGGNFGFWEHYWLRYVLDDVTYIIDLTLQQFINTAPKLAICIEHTNKHGYTNDYDQEGTPISQYAKDKRAFQFYTNPKNVE